MKHLHLTGPFGAQAALSSDPHHIRAINADLGDGKPYGVIAEIRYRNELTQEENLATAELFRAAPELRDMLNRLNEKVKRANAIQHSGTKIQPEDWAELYQLSNEASALLAPLV